MDVPALPDENGKSWDYPLTTDEMREHKNDWSLASDVGLLRHLQKFSENITSKVEKTQSALDDLSTGLNEASLMVDNVTNISLALANTQFIESRVRDDETDANCLKKNEEEIKDLIKEPSESDMITAVSTSILEGLKLMDEKYERLEVIASSDSDDDDDDDENEMPAQSVIIKPKDFYQNRGLPYVIGSEKWKSSNKIGLESSSSESEMPDEEEEEEEDDDDDDDEEDMRGEYPDSEKETKLPERIFSSSSRSKGISRSSSCTSTSVSSDSKSNNTNEQSSHTGKIYTRSQDTLNSTSEIETITNEILTKDIRKETPSFAEELARRLGNVFPARKKSIDNNHHHDSDQASINRSHDDLFESDDDDDDGEDNNDVLSKKKDNLFGDTCDLFDDDKLTSDLWKNKPAVRVQKNIIPSSLDVPPPINTVDVKPKSSIDDLFRDNYSDDSDDIFAPKSSWLSSKSPSKSLKSQDLDREKSDKVKRVDNVMTSTPEANNNIPNLFNDDDEDNDDDNLFSPFDKNISKINNEKSKNSSRQVPGVLINKTDLLSSTLGSRLLNRKLNSDSSENESNEANKDNKNRESSVGSFMVNKSESMLFAGNIQQQQQQQQHDQEQPDHTNNENPSGDSSGISIQPRSVNSTLGLGLGEWEPQMESTRLRSEEIYREPILSDSLLTSPVNKPEIINEHSYNNNNSQATQESSKLSDNNINDYDDVDDEDDDDDDVFGPPPLPQKTTSKIKSNISSSLFDDSDSGDDLFSNTSSGSRSQKSTTDHQAATHEKSNEKSKVIKSRGLFDEPYDLFSNTSVPDIDIFNVQPPPPTTSNLNEQKDKAQSLLITSDKKLFKPVSNLFDDEDDDYLFGVTLSTENKKPVEIMEENKSQAGLLKSENLNDDKISNEEIKKSSEEDKKLSEKNKIPSEKDEEQSKKNIFDDIDDASNSSLFDDKSKKPNKTTVDKVEEKTTIDGPVASKINTEKVKNDITKIEPPKTLKIRLPNISDTDDTSQVTKRVVSNKIANIMGKMSNLKILSPTDTPPLFRKSTEKSETDDDNSEYDSQDGSSVSLPKSLPQSPKKEFEIKNTPTSPTTLETESAVSFDVPAQPETLLVRSKSRAKITAKRRPQSRHARQTALRHSGLDFDSVDAVDSKTTEEPIDRLSDKQPNIISLNSTVDDKSEMSLGKESSISITKNTLLSPSTDEEDLFDVPPDLPEDPQREDTLFGRGPILSPFDDDNAKQKEDKKVINYKKTEEEKIVNKKLEKDEDPLSKKEDDILKDPSQLFARVTKTPSPEKNRNQIFDEDDDSLFSEASMKDKNKKGKKETIEEVKKGRNDDNGGKKIDLFGDDDDDTSDLFSGPFTKKIGKKSVKTTTRGLFDDDESDDDEGDDLFGSASSKQSKSDDVAETINIIDAKKSNNEEEEEEEDEEELFFDASEKSTEAGKNNQQIKITKQKLENIFGDSENIDDDIFLNKNKSSTGLFDDDDKVPGSSTSNAESRGGVIKKPVTKDLKKTAEKIDEDPLSMFQDE